MFGAGGRLVGEEFGERSEWVEEGVGDGAVGMLYSLFQGASRGQCIAYRHKSANVMM